MNRIAAFCLLPVCLCLMSCSRKQSSQGSKEDALPPPPPLPQLAELLPTPGEVHGWAMSQKARSFRPEDLWQFIDGAADRYLAYGFEEVAASEFVQEGTGCRVLIDIYRMKDPLNAYGIYAQERSPDYQFLKVGNEGYSTGNTLNFWAGPYYVKITTFERNDAVMREISELARVMAAKVTAPGAEPVEIGHLPKTNQLPHTMAYIPRDVLGQSYLVHGFEAKYRADGRDYRMILVVLESPDAAQRAMARYRQFLSGSGKAVNDLAAPGQGGFSGKEDFYGDIIAVRSGRNIAMILGALSENERKKLLTELVENIR